MSDATERLLVRIDATTEQLRREMKRADDVVGKSSNSIGSKLAKFEDSFKRAGVAAAKWSVAVGAATAAVTAALVKSGLSTVDALAKTSDKLGVATENLAALRMEAELTGNSTQQLDMGLQRMTRRVAEAGQGMGEAKDALKELGLNAQELTRLAPDEIFVKVAEAMQNVESESDKVRLTFKLFDSEGVGLKNTLESVANKGFAAVKEQAEAAGVAISRIDAAKVEDANDAVLRITTAFSGLSQQLAVKFSGAIESAADSLSELLAESGGVSTVLEGAFNKASEAARFAAENFHHVVAAAEIAATIYAVKLVPSIQASVLGFTSATASSIRYQFALANMAGVSRTAAIAQTALGAAASTASKAFALMGGPAGVVLVAAVALFNFGTKSERARKQIDKLGKEIDGLTGSIKNLSKAEKEYILILSDKKLEALTEEYEHVERTIKKLELAQKGLNQQYDPEVMAKLRSEAERLNREIGEQRGKITDLKVAVAGLNDVEAKGVRVQNAWKDSVAGSVQSVDQLHEVTVTATRVNNEWVDSVAQATAAQDPFQKALQGTVERIDEAFADAWRGAFDSFSDFADGLKEGFRQLLGELSHMALTRPIVMNIAAGFGLGGASGAASATSGGLTSAAGLLPWLKSGIGSAGASLYNGLGTGASYLADFGVPGMDAFSKAAYGKGFTTSAASMGFDLAGGVAGGYLGNQVFGDTTGVGATLGGLGGSLLPIPIPGVGAAIGSFVGTAVESLFGKDGGNQAGATTFNTGSQFADSYGIGNSFSQSNVDQSAALAQVLQAFTNIVGGDGVSGRIKVGDRSGIKYDGKSYSSPEALFDDLFDQIIDGAAGLSDSLRTLISDFEGTAEETLRFSAAVLPLSEASGINSVTEAVKQYNAEMPSLWQAYDDQSQRIRVMVKNWNGSALGAERLNSAMLANKQAAYQMTIAIMQMADQIGAVAKDQAKSIRESVLSSQMLRMSRTKERNELRASLNTLVDPAEIEAASHKILELNRQIFDSLAPDQQTGVRANEFATYAENTALVADRLLSGAVDKMEDTQEDLNQRVAALLDSSGQTFQAAADTQLTAAQIFKEAVNQLSLGGSGLVETV